jgi:RNA polymerase sigma-70 factor (ECF subfamily)
VGLHGVSLVASSRAATSSRFLVDSLASAAISRVSMAEQLEQLGDGALVERTLQGERAAFGHLYDRYCRRVRAIVGGAGVDRSAVDDLTQECFLRAYRKLDRLEPRENLGPWLAGIARQVARERRRSLRRDRHRFVGSAPSDGRAGAGGQADPTLDEREELAIVMQRIAQLPERQRVAIELFFVEECNAEETARLLGMSRSGVYALLKRACRSVAASIASGTSVREGC